MGGLAIKKYIILFLILGLIISNVFLISKNSTYYEVLERNHEQAINDVKMGIRVSSREIRALASMVRNDFDGELRLIQTTSRISQSLQITRKGLVASLPFINLSIPRNRGDSMGEMYDFIDKIYSYINIHYIAYQFGEGDISKEEMVHTLETLHEGLNFIYENLDRDKLLEGDYATIKEYWHQLMELLLTKYPDNPVFIEYYDWHYNR